LYGLFFDDARDQVRRFSAPWVSSIYIKKKFTVILGLKSRVITLLLPSISLLTQHPRRYACSWSVSVFSLGRGRRQEHAACVGKNAPFSLLAAFIPLLNDKRCLEGWIRLFSSLFWVILGWFLFSFSPRIGRSNSNIC